MLPGIENEGHPFELANGWHQARTEVVVFEAEELFGTKLRALLYQIADGDGLALLVNTDGSKWWRLRLIADGDRSDCEAPGREGIAGPSTGTST